MIRRFAVLGAVLLMGCEVRVKYVSIPNEANADSAMACLSRGGVYKTWPVDSAHMNGVCQEGR